MVFPSCFCSNYIIQGFLVHEISLFLLFQVVEFTLARFCYEIYFKL